MPQMTMLQALQLRIDKANMNRTADDPIEARAQVGLYEKDAHGDEVNLGTRAIKSIGTDFIELNGEGLVDRSNIRCIFPLNF